MQASELIACLKYKQVLPADFADFGVSELTQDTRKVVPGAVFVAVVGHKVDGHQFIPQAVEKGAKLIVAEHPVETSVPLLVVRDSHRAMAFLANRYFGHPSQQLRMIGVTGTNGKTTVTHLIEEIFSRAGDLTGVIGTLYRKIGAATYPTINTTPDAITNQRTLAKMVAAKVDTVAMEVSSIALQQGRVWGIDYDIAVFTNFTEDHLAYHKTMDQYKLAKSLLFAQLGSVAADKAAVLNVDDPVGREFADYTAANVITYAIDHEADVRAQNVALSLEGIRFDLTVFGQHYRVATPLVGRFNVANCLAAIAAAVAAGLPVETIIAALSTAHGVRGRFQKVPTTTGVTVIVDYAHTPDGLEKVLTTLNQFAEHKVYCVVGCGGDRDAKKRPLMAQIAVKGSTQAILTEDNPRTEDPKQIMNDMLAGIDETMPQPEVIYDRAAAIKEAINRAQPGDAVLIAGKGHEDYQIIGTTKRHFDDFEQAAAALEEKAAH